jgi:two-component system response regulator FixJ
MIAKQLFIVEDDAELRSSLTRFLNVSGYQITGFESAESFLNAFTNTSPPPNPDCIVLDVNLPGINGVEAQHKLREQNISCPIIFVSAELNARNVNKAWRDGATDFLFKPFAATDLLNCIRKVIDHQNKTSVDQIKPYPETTQTKLALEQATLIQSLTPRQLEVLLWLVEGLSNTKIGNKLKISARTVKMHREALMQRLGIRHITELARIYENCKHLL